MAAACSRIRGDSSRASRSRTSSRSSSSNATQARPRGVTATNSSPIGESTRRRPPHRAGRDPRPRARPAGRRPRGRAGRPRRPRRVAFRFRSVGVMRSAPGVASFPGTRSRGPSASLQPISSAISSYGRSSTWRWTTATRCLGGRDRTAAHNGSWVSVGAGVAARAGARGSGTSSTGTGAPAARPMVVDRLPRGDREDPTVELRPVRDARVGAQRRQERLLEAVVGVARPHRHGQEPVDGGAVRLEERPERRDRRAAAHGRPRSRRAHRAHPFIQRCNHTRTTTASGPS